MKDFYNKILVANKLLLLKSYQQIILSIAINLLQKQKEFPIILDNHKVTSCGAITGKLTILEI